MAPRTQIVRMTFGMLPKSSDKAEIIYTKIRHGRKPNSYQ